jgi:hypothetical protein
MFIASNQPSSLSGSIEACFLPPLIIDQALSVANIEASNSIYRALPPQQFIEDIFRRPLPDVKRRCVVYYYLLDVLKLDEMQTSEQEEEWVDVSTTGGGAKAETLRSFAEAFALPLNYTDLMEVSWDYLKLPCDNCMFL